MSRQPTPGKRRTGFTFPHDAFNFVSSTTLETNTSSGAISDTWSSLSEHFINFETRTPVINWRNGYNYLVSNTDSISPLLISTYLFPHLLSTLPSPVNLNCSHNFLMVQSSLELDSTPLFNPPCILSLKKRGMVPKIFERCHHVKGSDKQWFRTAKLQNKWLPGTMITWLQNLEFKSIFSN